VEQSGGTIPKVLQILQTVASKQGSFEGTPDICPVTTFLTIE